MKNKYTFKAGFIGLFVAFIFCCQSIAYSQVTLNATGGLPIGSYTTISDAFSAINAGTHSGNILISITGNTTEPVAPVYLAASGQGAASYIAIGIKPTVAATVSCAASPGYGVINFDGADNVTIDGSITIGGTTRDLTIQNTSPVATANTTVIRLIGRTTLGLGATNITIDNCNIVGNTPGNNGTSGSTVATSYGIYAGSTAATTLVATTGGADYDNLIIRNNLVINAYIGINIIGLTANQANNLVVQDNTIGSVVSPIGFRGLAAQHLVGGNMTNNLVTSIINTALVSIAGIEIGGSATAGFQINRNTITDVQALNVDGWGAYGINVTAGTGVVISNNAISGVRSVNYINSSQYDAFGIRLTGGTGHQIYYNSINMYGAYTTGDVLTNAFSVALIVTSTTVTGLEIRNNVFSNKMTSTATTPEFIGVCFPSGYNFANANLERNAYMVQNDAQHFVGKIGTTAGVGNYSTLTAWKAISQVGNPTNDVNSAPVASNSPAPFTSDGDLTIPALTVTQIESGALSVVALGLPNVDRTNVFRPAGTGLLPDMGAYEFEGIVPGDLSAPVVSGVSAAPGASCSTVPHTVTATITDNVGVTTATLSYSFNGVPQTPITMTLSAGTPLNGTYTGVIPAAVGPLVLVSYSVVAVDAAMNTSAAVSGPSYTDEYLVVTASPDQLINTGVGTTISATTNDPSFGRMLISEVVQFKTGTGAGVYPAYIPVADNDFVELNNFGNIDADVSGFTMTLYGGVTGSYTIPTNTFVASGSTLVLAFTGTTSDPANNYFGMNLLAATSGSPIGYVLRNLQGQIVDVVATNGYTFTVPSGVTAGDWIGNIPSTAGLAGVRRTVATDNDAASDWTVSSAVNVMTIGVYNSEITIVPVPATITWTTDFDLSTSTNNPLTVAPFPLGGVYTYTATFTDGTCTATDDVAITVIAPVAPEASFSATPLAGSAPLVVNFTDLSTNIPTGWTWIVTPATGVTYTGGTSSSSQNPIMQFDNAGVYTITLIASNIAGSDDSTIVDYITVSICGSSATNTPDTDIGNVTFGSLNNGIGTPIFSNPTANGGYTDFTALPVQTFGLGQTYPISLTQITSDITFYDAHFNVFIDYNNDGYFDPVTERVFDAPTSDVGPISTVSGNVTIPVTAVQGNVFMRVVLQEGGNSTSPPCGTYDWGETEDYIINLQCSTASPTAGNDAICTGETSTLTSAANGVQWYSDGVTPVVLATGGTYTTGALTATTSYFASSTDPGCLESGRTEFIVTVNQPTSATQTTTSCVNYVWPITGMTYTATGMYTGTIPNAANCDSVITLNLTINAPTSSSVSQTTCAPYVWPITGMTYSTSGIYTGTIQNAANCDSVITLNLTVNAPTSATVAQTSCGAYVWPITGMTYSTTGMYVGVIPNAANCDSTITLNLTVVTLDLGITNTTGTLAADQSSATYQWYDCDTELNITGETSQTYTPTANGNYAVIVTVNGCSDTTACEEITGIGLNETTWDSTVSIVPNPTNNHVTISFEASEARLTVLDLNGKVLSTSTVHSGDQVDLSRLENGVYIFKIYTDSIRTIERVVKQ